MFRIVSLFIDLYIFLFVQARLDLQDPVLQSGIPLLLHFILHHKLEHLRQSHQAHTFFRPGHGRIDQVPGHQHPRPRINGDHHRRVFASLGFMYGNGIRQLQLLQLLKAVLHHPPLVKFHLQGLGKGVYLAYDAHIAVEDALALVHRDPIAIPHLPY